MRRPRISGRFLSQAPPALPALLQWLSLSLLTEFQEVSLSFISMLTVQQRFHHNGPRMPRPWPGSVCLSAPRQAATRPQAQRGSRGEPPWDETLREGLSSAAPDCLLTAQTAPGAAWIAAGFSDLQRDPVPPVKALLTVLFLQWNWTILPNTVTSGENRDCSKCPVSTPHLACAFF